MSESQGVKTQFVITMPSFLEVERALADGQEIVFGVDSETKRYHVVQCGKNDLGRLEIMVELAE